jgi:hypothetical protein
MVYGIDELVEFYLEPTLGQMVVSFTPIFAFFLFFIVNYEYLWVGGTISGN